MPTSTLLSFRLPTLMVVPWCDPVVDRDGHDALGSYVEMFWLNVLGPTNIALEPTMQRRRWLISSQRNRESEPTELSR